MLPEWSIVFAFCKFGKAGYVYEYSVTQAELLYRWIEILLTPSLTIIVNVSTEKETFSFDSLVGKMLALYEEK